MTRREISERATRRAQQEAQDRHVELHNRRIRELEDAERSYIAAGLEQFELLLADAV